MSHLTPQLKAALRVMLYILVSGQPKPFPSGFTPSWTMDFAGVIVNPLDFVTPPVTIAVVPQRARRGRAAEVH